MEKNLWRTKKRESDAAAGKEGVTRLRTLGIIVIIIGTIVKTAAPQLAAELEGEKGEPRCKGRKRGRSRRTANRSFGEITGIQTRTQRVENHSPQKKK